MLDEGVWLVWVTIDQLTGIAVFAVDRDGTTTVLSADGYVCLFPTRSGLADFLASGSQHTLSWQTVGFDPRTAEFDGAADFSLLRDSGSTFAPDIYDELWWACGVLCDACGIVPGRRDVAALMPLVAARTRLVSDFEQPGYAVADYWSHRQIVPFTLVLPSGSGVTLADQDVVCGMLPAGARFLGEEGTVWLFRAEEDLLDAIADGLPGVLRQEDQWRLDIDGRPPHCLGSTVIDLAALPLLEPTDGDTLVDTMGVLENLTWTLTGSRSPLLTRELSALANGEFPATLKPRRRRRAADQLRRLVTEVDTRITWR